MKRNDERAARISRVLGKRVFRPDSRPTARFSARADRSLASRPLALSLFLFLRPRGKPIFLGTAKYRANFLGDARFTGRTRRKRISGRALAT